METIGNLGHMTGGMLYWSITHLQREDTLQVFGCVGHVQPALWPRGCYCKHKGTEASACYAKRSGFLRFRIAVLVPILSRCLPVRHIGRCTHWAGTYSQTVLPLAPAPVLRLFCCPAPQGRPAWGKVHTIKRRRSDCCHGLHFEGSNAFFQKHIGAVPEGPV